MRAIEFDAVVQAHAIPLPKPVALAAGLPVRVVVMYERVETLPVTAAQEEDISTPPAAGDPKHFFPNAQKSEEFPFDEATLLAQIIRTPAAGKLSAAQLQTAGFRFDREEANER